jgi:hypothetical protein
MSTWKYSPILEIKNLSIQKKILQDILQNQGLKLSKWVIRWSKPRLPKHHLGVARRSQTIILGNQKT